MKLKILVTMFLAILATGSLAFTLVTTKSGAKGWDRAQIEFFLNSENCPAGVEDLLEGAMKIWNGVESSKLNLKFGGYSSTTLAEAQNRSSADTPVIFCVNNLQQAEPTLDPNSIPGFATGSHFDGDDFIDYGYIVLNVQPGARANISTMDNDVVKVVIAHEMGHLIGLGHSEDTNALMYYDASSKKKLSLAKDDVDGLTYLYARNELGKDKMMGCAMIDNPKPMSSSKVLGNLIFFLMPIFTLGAFKKFKRN